MHHLSKMVIVNHLLVEDGLNCVIMPTEIIATSGISVDVIREEDVWVTLKVRPNEKEATTAVLPLPIEEIGVLTTSAIVETDIPVRTVVCSGKVNLTTKNTILTHVHIFKGEVIAWVDYRKAILFSSKNMTSIQSDTFVKLTTIKVGRSFSDTMEGDKKIVTLQG